MPNQNTKAVVSEVYGLCPECGNLHRLTINPKPGPAATLNPENPCYDKRKKYLLVEHEDLGERCDGSGKPPESLCRDTTFLTSRARH